MPKHIGRNLRFDQEQYWVEIGDIEQTYGTLGRYCGHWVDIVDIRQTLSRHWADVEQTLGRVFSFLIQDKTFQFSYPR